MKKKLLSLTLSVLITASSLSALSCSAFSVGNKEELESTMNSRYSHASELTDIFFKTSEDVWIISDNDIVTEFMLENTEDDYIYVSLGKSCNPAEIGNLVGYMDKMEIRQAGSGIRVTFKSDNHELNYMLSEKIISKLDGYEVKGCQSQIGKATFEHIKITIPGIVYASGEERKTEILDEISAHTEEIKAINATLAENGIRVRLLTADEIEFESEVIDERYNSSYCRYAVFPDDMTVKEKMEYADFMRNNYNIDYDYYNYCNTAFTQNNNIDFSKVDISYNEYDANCDNEVNIADATAIVQAIGNPDRYGLSAQGEFNADSDGNGLTGLDALAIQIKLVNK